MSGIPAASASSRSIHCSPSCDWLVGTAERQLAGGGGAAGGGANPRWSAGGWGRRINLPVGHPPRLERKQSCAT
eukprot:7562994-Pyramimonas_sp.AAC.1